MTKSEEIVKLTGRCWHKFDVYYDNKCLLCCEPKSKVGANPNYESKEGIIPLLVLMMGKEDWRDFCKFIADKIKLYNPTSVVMEYSNFITTPGLLVDTVLGWLRSKGGNQDE